MKEVSKTIIREIEEIGIKDACIRAASDPQQSSLFVSYADAPEESCGTCRFFAEREGPSLPRFCRFHGKDMFMGRQWCQHWQPKEDLRGHS